MRGEMINLIRQSYTEIDVFKYISYKCTETDRDSILESAMTILKMMPPVANCCALMSAQLVAMIRNNTHIPIHMVAGTLDFNGKRIFGNDSEMSNLNEVFSNSNLNWNGHCWVVYDEYMIEISLFRTAYASESPRWLEEMIVNKFGRDRGIIEGRIKDIEETGLIYKAKYVLTDGQVSAMLSSLPFFIEKSRINQK